MFQLVIIGLKNLTLQAQELRKFKKDLNLEVTKIVEGVEELALQAT